MYLPPMIMVALLQVAGPDSGEQIASLPVSQPMLVAKAETQIHVAPTTNMLKKAKHDSKIAQVAANEEKNEPNADKKPEKHVVAKPDTIGLDAPPSNRQSIFDTDARIRQTQNTATNAQTDETVISSEFDAFQNEIGAAATPQGNISIRINDNEELIRMAVIETREVTLSAGLQGILKAFRVPKTDPRTDKVILDKNGKEILVPITEGLILRKGQIIGKIDDSEELAQFEASKAKLEVAETEAQRLIEIEYARAAYDLAYMEVEKYELMNKDIAGSVPHMVVLEAKTRKVHASKQWQKAQEDHDLIRPKEVKVQQMEVNITKERIKKRQIICPIDGMVVECAAKEGEWFREGDKMLRIIPLDKLYIRGRVDGTRLATGMVYGKQVTVKAKMIDGRTEEFIGVVDFASPELQQTTKDFYIHVNVDNRRENGSWLLRVKDNVDMIIHLDKDVD